jgi:PAS domain S-box-containing protein
MIALGLFPSAFTFLYLGVKLPAAVYPENTLTYSIFQWGVFPIIESIFFVLTDRLFYRKKDFQLPFTMFLFFYILSFILVISNIFNEIIYSSALQLGTAIVIILCIASIIKERVFSNWLFLLSICCFAIGGAALNFYMSDTEHVVNMTVILFSFFLGYTFLALIFGLSTFIKEKDGIGVFFSFENRLKKVEAALFESEQRYRQLDENLNEGIWILDNNGSTTFVNSYIAQMLGYTTDEMTGKRMFEFMDDNWIKIAEEKFRHILNNVDKEYEFEFLRKNKTRIYTSVRMSPLFDKKGNYIGALAGVQDISERKRIEYELHEKLDRLRKSELGTLNIMEDLQDSITNLQKAKEEINQKNEELQMMNQELNIARDQLAILNQDLEAKVQERTAEVEMLLKQKDDFINQLGHDLKTPLTPLNALLPLMKQLERDPKLLEFLDVCIRNVNYMKNLVSRTLELAQLNSPSSILLLENLSLVDEVNEVLKRKHSIFLDKNITINNNISNQLIIQADSMQIRELFDNIIINAVKYSTSLGSMKISIDAKEKGDRVIISVKDTGIGMNGEQLEHIFHEFYKADASRHTLESTGLGLSICKRIVEKHGGKIWAESPGLGKGSTFYFSLPISKNKTV